MSEDTQNNSVYPCADMDKSPPLTRRGLLQCLGSATLVAGCNPPATSKPFANPEVTPKKADVQTLGPKPEPLSFVLNGRSVSISVEPRITLLSLLRNHLNQTGTKEGCDRGACGACTVQINGLPKNACMTLAHDVENSEVRTVEGIGASTQLSILQQQFVAMDALQCGFCTSGMVASCDALLQRHAKTRVKIDETSVKAAIAGNLCRCGSYPHIVQAVLETARQKGLAE